MEAIVVLFVLGIGWWIIATIIKAVTGYQDPKEMEIERLANTVEKLEEKNNDAIDDLKDEKEKLQDEYQEKIGELEHQLTELDEKFLILNASLSSLIKSLKIKFCDWRFPENYTPHLYLYDRPENVSDKEWDEFCKEVGFFSGALLMNKIRDEIYEESSFIKQRKYYDIFRDSSKDHPLDSDYKIDLIRKMEKKNKSAYIKMMTVSRKQEIYLIEEIIKKLEEKDEVSNLEKIKDLRNVLEMYAKDDLVKKVEEYLEEPSIFGDDFDCDSDIEDEDCKSRKAF